jgi:hypothetical protein
LINYIHKKSSDLVLGGLINLFRLLKEVNSVERCTEGSMAQFPLFNFALEYDIRFRKTRWG